MKHAKKVQASGIKPHDDHSKQEGQDCEEVSRAVVYKAAKRALNASAGNAPQHVIKAIESLGEAKLPWKMLLRNSIMSQVSRKTQSTTKKINRRFQLPVPGKKKKREMILGVCVDESGSVSDEAHAAFMSEIQQISKLVTKTYIVHADCEVAAVDDLSKGKFKAERKASGGTMYQPAIDKCIQLKCNMIVYFGDFDTADKPKNPGVPFLWVGVGNSPAPAEFGKVIRL
jgi:predicted metal-dependent peptidase